MMLHSSEMGIGFGRNIRQWLSRVEMWVPSFISEEYMVRTVING
jgi:hypothetical protein